VMRGNLIQVRVDDEEKARVVTDAERAGVSVSELVRARLGLDAIPVKPSGPQESRPVEEPEPQRNPPPMAGAFKCPQGGCGRRFGSSRAICPDHGYRAVPA
jgi:hypothetical protein